MKLEQE